jgi:alkylation response protein AidB-like acyl-CoA dehydrogenase
MTTTTDLPSADAVRAEARAWLAEHWDPQLTVRSWWALLADSGWAYPTWPVEWYGKGFNSDLAQVVRSEIAAAGAVPPPHGIGQTMGAPVLLQFGAEEQKQRLLPLIAKGEESWCQFFSEPDAGSDLASLRTRAVRDGEEWVVNGQKIWNSGTLTADRGVMPLRSDPDVPKHRGLSFFIIDVDQPGIDIRPIKQMNGESHFNETFFTDARVRHDDLIGGLNNGWAVTLATLANERSSYAAGADYGGGVAPGEKSGMLDLTCSEAVEATLASQQGETAFPLGDASALIDLAREYRCLDDPSIRQRLMKLHAMSEAARVTALRAKAAAEAGRAPGPESSLGYIAGVHLARATRDLGLAILGAGGMLVGDAAPRNGSIATMALTSLVHGIQGGTEQIQRNIVGERVLGLPKEPQVDRDIPFKDVLKS